MSIKYAFGKKLKEKRLALGLTQEELAEKIGLTAKSLSQIELGNNFVSAEKLETICLALQTSPSNMFELCEFDDKNVNKFDYIVEKIKNNESLLVKVYKFIRLIQG